ncbi:hypothetical protein TPHA_0B01990 [Tetrapisispora phaffii CBS 4417]|uniref:Actin cortical patch SUR7/pH-response regulator pali n=1 Tax=Tetrapisispora phaffii (strain ATCC 24235 / CBS 4417 / NBRC 1672 / NRRL Y-8282 / UCD 70-5) TaxID=1071381 RepID=G8BPE0_TETPH|nr:hypothetical protein TPHA_0B01990 [Tetrapisispora phaffii CBS 4417]CCE61871.1 hypothetical protein TPHA_0B01990 [Tetrapisispora phaffii CBS 4417]
MANGAKLFLAGIITFVSFIIAIVSFAGSTSNYKPINEIYVAHLNLKNIKNDAVFTNLTQALDSNSLPNYINIGLWSYCISGTNSDKIEKCTSPKGIQEFDLKTLLYDNVANNESEDLLDSIDDILLPDSIANKKGYYNGLSRCMWITLIIGIIVLFLDLIFIILRMLFALRALKIIGLFLACVAFASLIISGSTSVATYVYIKVHLNKNYDEYGIKLDLGRNFFCILWGSILGSLLNLLLWVSVRDDVRRTYVTQAGPSQSGKRIIL